MQTECLFWFYACNERDLLYKIPSLRGNLPEICRRDYAAFDAEHLGGVIGAFETDTGNYELYEISPETFKQNMRETRSTGAAAGKVILVLQKIFKEEGKFIQTVKLNK